MSLLISTKLPGCRATANPIELLFVPFVKTNSCVAPGAAMVGTVNVRDEFEQFAVITLLTPATVTAFLLQSVLKFAPLTVTDAPLA